MSVVFLDTETTGLDPDIEEIFEIAVVKWTPTGWTNYVAHLEPDPGVLARMHPKALEVNRYFERTSSNWLWHHPPAVAAELTQLLDGVHIAGAVPDFDARFLTAFFKKLRLPRPNWHYHLIDVEVLATGFLAAKGQFVDIPYDSEQLSRLLGIDPDAGYDRHTALSDARWAKAMFEACLPVPVVTP